MCHLRQTFQLAQKMGEGVGGCEILQRQVQGFEANHPKKLNYSRLAAVHKNRESKNQLHRHKKSFSKKY
jgi:hypothetical protein